MQIRNSINLIGHVGQEPEIINGSNGVPFLRFSLATNDYYNDKDGNRVTRTEWHSVVVFGNRAKMLQPNIHKGSFLAINGSLRYRKWTDKNDQPRISASVHANDIVFLNPKSEKAEEAALAEKA